MCETPWASDSHPVRQRPGLLLRQGRRGLAAPLHRQVEYSGHGYRKRYRDADLVLDLTPYKHTLVERDDLHRIYQSLKEIKTVMKSWTSDRRLRVTTVTQAEVDEQHQRWLEERAARRAAQASGADPSELQPWNRSQDWISRMSGF